MVKKIIKSLDNLMIISEYDSHCSLTIYYNGEIMNNWHETTEKFDKIKKDFDFAGKWGIDDYERIKRFKDMANKYKCDILVCDCGDIEYYERSRLI